MKYKQASAVIHLSSTIDKESVANGEHTQVFFATCMRPSARAVFSREEWYIQLFVYR